MSEVPQFGDKYRLLWRLGPEPIVAEIFNYAIESQAVRVIPVIRDDATLADASMRFLFVSWDNQGPRITVNGCFLSLPKIWREAALWHEVGHVHYEHHFQELPDSLRSVRISAIEGGGVMPQELEADVFAAARIGKAACIAFLRHLLSTRPRGTAWNDLGAKELERRILAVQELPDGQTSHDKKVGRSPRRVAHAKSS